MRLAVSLAGSPARTCRLGERRRRTERDLHVASPIRERLPDVGSGHRPPEPGAALMRRPLWALLVLPVALRGLPASEAQAAIAFVKNVGTNGSTTTGTTLGVTVPVGGVQAGDTLIVTFAMDPQSGTVSVADSKGNAYTSNADVQRGGNGSGNGVRTVVLSAPVTKALTAGDLITVTHPSVAARAVSV